MFYDFYKVYVLCYMLYVVCYMLYVICYMLYVICYMYIFIYTRYYHDLHDINCIYTMFLIFFFFFKFRAHSRAPSRENRFQVAKFSFEVRKSSSLFCLAQYGPGVTWVACIGLRECSKWSLGCQRACAHGIPKKIW